MKRLDEWDFLMDDYAIYKEDKEGLLIEDDDGEFVEVDEKTPITYGMLKGMMEVFVSNLKQDLKDLADMIPEESD